mgnify:CR=1 FL=1
MNKTQFLNTIVIVSGNEFSAGMKIYVSLIFRFFLAENRLKYGENGTIDLIFNYWGKIKINRNFYDGRNFCQKFLGTSGHRWGFLKLASEFSYLP